MPSVKTPHQNGSARADTGNTSTPAGTTQVQSGAGTGSETGVGAAGSAGTVPAEDNGDGYQSSGFISIGMPTMRMRRFSRYLLRVRPWIR
nr:hypothetical protein [Arthrobacter sp. H14]